MKENRHFSGRVANVFYGPVLMGYVWIAVGVVWAGLAICAIGLVLTLKLGIFARFKEWPVRSRAAVYLSPMLLAFGFYFSTMGPTYWILAPFIIHTLLCIAGGLALGKELPRAASSGDGGND
jgi:hypothetical protein